LSALRAGPRSAVPLGRRGVSIGETLAEARRRAGLSMAQVSEQTRIGETIIAGIEGDDYSACGGDFNARGHIRSIAAAVGADPRPLIDAYDAARSGPPARDEEVTEPLTAVRVPQHLGPMPVTPPGMRQERPSAGPVTLTAGRRRQRRPLAWAVALGVVLVAGLGCVGYFLANTGHAAAPGAGAHPAMPRRAGQASHAVTAAGGAPATAPAATTPAAAPPRTLTPASAAAFGSSGGQGDNSDLAGRAIDGNPATAWHTDWYATARFGNLYPCTDLLVDMGRPVTITAARVTLGRAHGASFQLRVGAAPALASLRPVAHAVGAGGVVHLRLTRPAAGRYVLIWFTRLPPDPGGTFQASVYELELMGRS
jgi:transcriptional regulator with XRE-family HTH domain